MTTREIEMFFDAMWARLSWELVPLLVIAILIGAFCGGAFIYCAAAYALKRVIGMKLW